MGAEIEHASLAVPGSTLPGICKAKEQDMNPIWEIFANRRFVLPLVSVLE
jgi:hypothetical protein